MSVRRCTYARLSAVPQAGALYAHVDESNAAGSRSRQEDEALS